VSDNYERIHRFFTDLGFSIYRTERFDSFGDYIIEACSPYFCLKGVSDRSVESLEARSLNDSENWYDMGLVMTCAGQKGKLHEAVNLETDMKFVETHLDELITMFDEENYPTTKTRLEKLGMLRAKEAFPGLFPN